MTSFTGPASKRRQEDSPSASADNDPQQIGFGLEPDFISRVATLVANQLNKTSQENDVRQEIALAQIPRPVELPGCIVVPEKTAPPINYDVQAFQNDPNDGFDEKYLLRQVPKKSQAQAQNLLKVLNERANELTWSSSGSVFVDGTSIPNSDIFKIFPSLFKKQSPKRMKGFQEFVQKLRSMGLCHLIPIKETQAISTSQAHKAKNESISQWWYIGE